MKFIHSANTSKAGHNHYRHPCDPDPLIHLKGNAGNFVAGPFHNGDQVEIAHGPSLIPRQAPSTFGGNIATIQLNGDALLWAVDSSGNASTPIKCK